MSAKVLTSELSEPRTEHGSRGNLLLIIGAASAIFGTVTFLIQADHAGIAEVRASQFDPAAASAVADARLWMCGGILLAAVGLCLAGGSLATRVLRGRKHRSTRHGASPMPPRFARHLRKLASLHAEGILTDAEYEQGKRKLLE